MTKKDYQYLSIAFACAGGTLLISPYAIAGIALLFIGFRLAMIADAMASAERAQEEFVNKAVYGDNG